MFARRVLLAEADAGLAGYYQEYLSREGFYVVTAATGLDCLGRLRTFGPEVLVLDAALPWGRGEGVLAVMHEEPGLPTIPVVLLAGEAGEGGAGCLDRFPVAAYHRKPLAPALLAASIRRALERRPVESVLGLIPGVTG